MADINIERKGASVWPWIIGLLVLAIVAFVVMQYMKDRNSAGAAVGPDTIPAAQVQTAPPPVTPDSIAGGSTTTDSVPATTTTSQ